MKKSSALSLELPKEAMKTSPTKSIRHYDSTNIDQMVWPECYDNNSAKDFLTSFIKLGTKNFIDNVEAKMNVLVVDSHVVPIIIIDEVYENSFVCSPYGHYISYALEASETIMKQKILSQAMRVFVKGLGFALRKTKVNKIIYVNNWLFPTDIHSKEIHEDHVAAITSHLTKQFPNYSIAFKSVNKSLHGRLSEALHSHKYDFVVTRQVFLTDTSKEEIFQTRIFKSDLKMLRESKYTVVDKEQLKEKDYEKILKLYRKLYLDKYSKLNPQHNKNFIDLISKSDLFQIKAIKKDEEVDGFFGYFIRDGIMTAPLFGYDEKPEEKSLYRLLSTIMTLEAKQKGCLLHQSAGASFYKKVRRAEPQMEYMAVYSRHLPVWRQLPWKFLKWIMNCFERLFKDY